MRRAPEVVDQSFLQQYGEAAVTFRKRSDHRLFLKRSYTAVMKLKSNRSSAGVDSHSLVSGRPSRAGLFFHYNYAASQSHPAKPRSVVERQDCIFCPWCARFPSLGRIQFRNKSPNAGVAAAAPAGVKRQRGWVWADKPSQRGNGEEEEEEEGADCSRWTRSSARAVYALCQHIRADHGAPFFNVSFAVDETCSLHVYFVPCSDAVGQESGSYAEAGRAKEFAWICESRGRSKRANQGVRCWSEQRRLELHHIQLRPPAEVEEVTTAQSVGTETTATATATAAAVATRYFNPQTGVPMTSLQRKCLISGNVPSHPRPPTGTGADTSGFSYPICPPAGTLGDILPGSLPSNFTPFDVSSSAVLTRSEAGIDDLNDLSSEERFFFKLWNKHVYIMSCTRYHETEGDSFNATPVPLLDDLSCTFTHYGDSFVPWSCEVFVRTYRRELYECDCRFELIAHFLNLHDFGLLSAVDLKRLMLEFDEYICSLGNGGGGGGAGGISSSMTAYSDDHSGTGTAAECGVDIGPAFGECDGSAQIEFIDL